MPKFLLPAVSLALLLSGSTLAQANPAAPRASKTDQPFNIGFVLYTKGKVPGTRGGITPTPTADMG